MRTIRSKGFTRWKICPAQSIEEDGLVVEAYEWDEEVSSYDNEMAVVKALMALADDESGAIGKESAKNDSCVKISIKKVNKVQVMGTLDGRLLKSYRYRDLRALHFRILLCCEIFAFQVEQFKPMGFLMPPEQSYFVATHFGGVTVWYLEPRLAMSSDKASSVTPPLSSAYVPDPMELDEHVPVYVPEPEHPKYHVPTDDDIQVKDQPYANDTSPIVESPGHIADLESIEEDYIDYPDEPEDDDEDPEEDPEEDYNNP
ncbi:hypothetical protein Tco_0558998 [Tanacetum coccineum]